MDTGRVRTSLLTPNKKFNQNVQCSMCVPFVCQYDNLLHTWHCSIKNNTRTLSGNIKFICTRLETRKNSSTYDGFFFLSLIKALTNKFYICRQCRYIVYIYPTDSQ